MPRGSANALRATHADLPRGRAICDRGSRWPLAGVSLPPGCRRLSAAARGLCGRLKQRDVDCLARPPAVDDVYFCGGRSISAAGVSGAVGTRLRAAKWTGVSPSPYGWVAATTSGRKFCRAASPVDMALQMGLQAGAPGSRGRRRPGRSGRRTAMSTVVARPSNAAGFAQHGGQPSRPRRPRVDAVESPSRRRCCRGQLHGRGLEGCSRAPSTWSGPGGVRAAATQRPAAPDGPARGYQGAGLGYALEHFKHVALDQPHRPAHGCVCRHLPDQVQARDQAAMAMVFAMPVRS